MPTAARGTTRLGGYRGGRLLLNRLPANISLYILQHGIWVEIKKQYTNIYIYIYIPFKDDNSETFIFLNYICTCKYMRRENTRRFPMPYSTK